MIDLVSGSYPPVVLIPRSMVVELIRMIKIRGSNSAQMM